MTAMTNVREFCRRRAVELIEQGESRDLIARVLGVSRQSINVWWRMACAGEDLAHKPPRGRPRRLNDKQLAKLAELLKKGAGAHGWQNNLWTSLRVGQVIKKHFGVDYSRSGVWHILTNQLHWTAKRPVQQLSSRDDDAILSWVRDSFPRIVREAAERQEFLVFVDETGFMMYSTVRKTFSPRGETPVNKVTDPHGRISTIGAIAISPKEKTLGWHYYMLEENTNCRFSEVLDPRFPEAFPPQGPLSDVE